MLPFRHGRPRGSVFHGMDQMARGLLLQTSSYNSSFHNDARWEFPTYHSSSCFLSILHAGFAHLNPNGENNILISGVTLGKTYVSDQTSVGETSAPQVSIESSNGSSCEITCNIARHPFERNCILARKPLFLTLKTRMLDGGNVSFRVSSRAASGEPNKIPEYQMPTVTWGVVQGRKEKLVSRVIICDYLRSIGIVPDELEHLELPSTVDVMKERVDFLQRLGLTIDDINQYPLMLGCSVRKNMVPVLDYLNKLGFQKQELPSFLRKHPQVLHASVIVDLVPVTKFLRGLDIERIDIPVVLQKYPELFEFKLEGTMSTSVAYLVSIGVNPRDIGPMVTQYPQILGMRVGKVIKPIVAYLENLRLPKQVLARMIEKRPYILGYELDELMKRNVESLLSFGVRREALASVIAQYPQILGLNLKPKLTSQQYFFNFNIKIGPEDFGRILEKMPQVVSLPHVPIKKRVEFFRGRGFSDEDIAKMVVSCPQLLVVNVELMKRSFYYFKTEIKKPLGELVDFPSYFTYSLEFRIKSRFQRMSRKGIRCSLAWMLNCSDQRFEERLEGNYIENEDVGPSFSMGGTLESPRDAVDSEEEDEESEDEVFYRRKVSV